MLWNKINASIKRRNQRGAPQRSVLSQIEESGLLSQTPDSFLKRGVSFLKSRILFSKEAFHFSKKVGLAQKPRAEHRISKDQIVQTCRHSSHATGNGNWGEASAITKMKSQVFQVAVNISIPIYTMLPFGHKLVTVPTSSMAIALKGYLQRARKHHQRNFTRWLRMVSIANTSAQVIYTLKIWTTTGE